MVLAGGGSVLLQQSHRPGRLNGKFRYRGIAVLDAPR